MNAGYSEEDAIGSTYDDLALFVEVDPPAHGADWPEFRVAEVGGGPVARGEISPSAVAGTQLGGTVITTDGTLEHLRAAWRTGRQQRFVSERPEGRYDMTVTPMVAADGAVRLLVHMVERHDPGERRRNIVNAAIVDALPGSVALLDQTGTIRAVNLGWVRYGLERSHDGVLADAGTDYLAVADSAAVHDPSAKQAAEAIRSVLNGEVDMASADYPAEGSGSREWYTLRVAPVEVDGERWAVVSHEDVSALRHALDRWHSTFSNAAVPTVMLDNQGQIVSSNAAFGELVGMDLPSTLWRPALDFVHPDDQGAILERLTSEAGEPLTTPHELRIMRTDGSTAAVVIHPSSVVAGQLEHAVVQLIDVTKQRRAEQRLALHRELLELVAAGTPLADVATAVAINIGRVIDGATGAVVLTGREAFLASGLRPDALDRGWRVLIDRSRPDSGELVVIHGDDRQPADDDRDTATTLASVVRLALQRDEAPTPIAPGAGLTTGEVFAERLGRALAASARRNATAAVLAVGPVDFEDLLSLAGWRGAEAVLADIAAVVRGIVPDAAVIARRADHLMVLVEVDDAPDADRIAELLVERAGLAVGVAAADVDTDADELVAEAESALADARMRAGEDDTASELRHALAAGEITVHYQPIVDLHSGATVSLEALIRWEHPTRGFVPPPELIHAAELSGLIAEVGALVLTTACRDLAGWRAAGAPNLTVAVNLSARQLAEPDLVAIVRTAIGDAGLEPSALVVEITESVVVDDVDLVARSLAALRELGVRVAIDDFGTGYSSLLYLKRFPADVLKVDRSFVQGLGIHDGDTAIVEAVVGLGHRLGLEVVAEGVETVEQLTELRRRRCDQAQGFLLQRPVPAAEIGAFLGTGRVDLGPAPAPVQESDLDVDELLSLITHELSTPLSVIGGHAELLADLMRSGSGDDGNPGVVLDALERNIKNLDDLLKSLADLGYALGSPAPPTQIDLAAFVEQTVSDLGPLVAQHDVRLGDTGREVLAEVEPVAVRQILTNLLSNAVKFTDPGTVIDIDVRTTDQVREIVVADHGPGVPADREGELFGRFARLGAQARGLGLGLHLSRSLARRQGGDLVHVRTAGGGATFALRLPAC